MKICEKCRCQNTDTRVFCVDCGATLREKLSDEQDAVYEQQLDENIKKIYNRNDPPYVSFFDIVVGVLALIGCVATITFLFFKPAPDFLYDTHPYILAFVFFAVAALGALLPKLAWCLEPWRLNPYLAGGRRAGNTIALGMGITILLLILFYK